MRDVMSVFFLFVLPAIGIAANLLVAYAAWKEDGDAA